MLSFRAIYAFYITPDTNTDKNRRTDRISLLHVGIQGVF